MEKGTLPEMKDEVSAGARTARVPVSSGCATLVGALCFPATLMCSWFTLSENEEAVIMHCGKYSGKLTEPGCHFVNMCGRQLLTVSTKVVSHDLKNTKVVDANGNPVNVSAVITYKVCDVEKATLDVTQVHAFVSNQAQAVLKQVVSRYPYESTENRADLKNESQLVSQELVRVLQERVNIAGLLILGFQFNEISLAPEIANAMLKRQQAAAMVAARKIIVHGAVEIAHTAVEEMTKKGVKFSDDERAKLVTNLLTVICSDHDAQPTLSLSS